MPDRLIIPAGRFYPWTITLYTPRVIPSEKAVIRIPVCYGGAEGPDLASLADLKQLTEQEVVSWHTKEAYRIYMIGFLPGFPYMASVPKEIEAPRKAQPAPVAAGSIG